MASEAILIWEVDVIKRSERQTEVDRRPEFSVLPFRWDTRRLAWSPDGRMLAAASQTRVMVQQIVRDAPSAGSGSFSADLILRKELELRANLSDLKWDRQGRRLAVAADSVLVYDAEEDSLRVYQHEWVSSLAWSPDGTILAASGADGRISIWEVESGRKTFLEGHKGHVLSVDFSFDGLFLASKSWDDTVWIRRTDNWEPVAVWPERASADTRCSLAFHPSASLLATVGEGRVTRIWELDPYRLMGKPSAVDSLRYTTAKVVLVGDSGVGKTALGWRIAHGEFKEQASSHGQQFWVVEAFGQTLADGTECEAVLWDLAGQPDYRLVHSLFLDDVDLALLVFDPTARQEPLASVLYWLKQLGTGDERRAAILVGARADRGAPTLTEEELDVFCKTHQIGGGFILTSALDGQGVRELMNRIYALLRWDAMTATVTTTTFKRIKERVLTLKESRDAGDVLLSPQSLRTELEHDDGNWRFDDEEMLRAVRHLETHGFVTLLHSSQGETSILLAPDLLTNLASSLVLEARRNPRGLGVLEEDALLSGEYRFPETSSLAAAEAAILIDAAVVLFLQHNLCFRETFSNRTFLVFPSLINEKRPLAEDLPVVDDVSYRITGPVENLYASLVVLLGYTNLFTRTNQWQNQAQYQLGESEVCGFRQTVSNEGEIELVLYYGVDTPGSVQLLFQGMVERLLNQRRATVSRYRPVVCTSCEERQARNVVLAQLGRGRDFLFCNNCGERLGLQPAELLAGSPRLNEAQLAREQGIALRRTVFEASLTRIKALLRDRGAKEPRPTCFLSYAWGISDQERWVLRLARDLQNAGVEVLLDRWHNSPGQSITRFMDQILDVEYVLVIGTPELLEKYKTEKSDRVVASELLLINTRVRKPLQYDRKVIPLLLKGIPDKAFPPQLQDLVHMDFTDESKYFVNLLALICQLHKLPQDAPLRTELMESLMLAKL